MRGVRRNALAAVDARAGRLTNFEPEITGYSVNALALDRSTLYVGGDFETAARSPRTGNAAFDISSGALLGWYPKVAISPSWSATARSTSDGGRSQPSTPRQGHT